MQPLFPFSLSRNEGLDKQEVQLCSLVSCSCDSLCHFFFTPMPCASCPPSYLPTQPLGAWTGKGGVEKKD